MSNTIGRALVALVNGASALQKPWRRASTRLQVSERLVQEHKVETSHGPLAFRSSHRQALQYPRDFFESEPETLAWIDRMATPSVFWDVGANIGAYALYAGLRPGISVVAFEPASANYAALCENLRINGLADRVAAYCVALGDRTMLSTLNMQHVSPGSVGNGFATETDSFGGPIHVTFRQGMVGFSIDEFRATFGLPAPNYLKIDVDSIEELILAGAVRTLADPALREICIELEREQTPRVDAITARLAAAGFTCRSTGAAGGPLVLNGFFTRTAA